MKILTMELGIFALAFRNLNIIGVIILGNLLEVLCPLCYFGRKKRALVPVTYNPKALRLYLGSDLFFGHIAEPIT